MKTQADQSAISQHLNTLKILYQDNLLDDAKTEAAKILRNFGKLNEFSPYLVQFGYTHHYLGLIAEQENDTQSALKHYDQQIACFQAQAVQTKDDRFNRMILTSETAHGYYKQASCYVALRDIKKAKQFLNYSISEYGEFQNEEFTPAILCKLAKSFYRLALCEKISGNTQEEYQFYLKSLEQLSRIENKELEWQEFEKKLQGRLWDIEQAWQEQREEEAKILQIQPDDKQLDFFDVWTVTPPISFITLPDLKSMVSLEELENNMQEISMTTAPVVSSAPANYLQTILTKGSRAQLNFTAQASNSTPTAYYR
ncbi:MAG: hypothetical protein RIT35_552 [Pseudomonadota bacterium]|jgi:tetratricopeptide (TPR) repeat protein